MSNVAHRLASEMRLRRLCLIYHQLPESAQQGLHDAAVQLSNGQYPARIQVRMPDPLESPQSDCDLLDPPAS